MPVYNAAPYLEDSIGSILNQTYQNFEFVIINDGSTDNSADIIRKFTDQRIRFIDNGKNEGIIKSRNKGLQLASGKYIANMDADDISLPQRLERQLRFLEAHPEIAVLATRLVLINTQNEETGIWPEDYNCVSELSISNTLPVINCIGQPTVMMLTEMAKAIGYNDKFKNNEDWGLWLNILSRKGRIAKLPEILLKYRQHPVSTTVSANKSGVEKKILIFKFRYLKDKLSKNDLRNTDKNVFISFIKDLGTFLLKRISLGMYASLTKVKNINPGALLRQFIKVKSTLKNLRKDPGIIYVFPYFHTGGAERVHASIVEAVNNKDSLTFIIAKSDDKAFYSKLSEHSTVLEIDELVKFGPSERWVQRKIGQYSSSPKGICFFGSNAQFFYNTIPFLASKTFTVDLLHAFVHDYELGPEKWSLPHIDKLDCRVVISQKTKTDLENLYRKNNIPEKYLTRLQVIPNFVEAKGLPKTKSLDVLKVVYVGRAGEEKRVGLIAQLARNLSGQNAEFHFIGNVEPAISEDLRKYCIFHGVISDDKLLDELYDDFHIIVIASSREGFPMVIMEAMMHGVVPVSTAVGGIPDHLKNNVNSVLIQASDEERIIDEFGEKIRYLNNNRNELGKLSENAYQYALGTFNKTSFFRAYSTLLNKKS